MNHYDVIVIGLGPSGSMAALMLESYGIKVLCIDKEKEIYNLPRAVTISDQGFRMAQLAGIEDIYERNSTTLGGAYFTDKDLEIIGGAIDLNNFITQNGWPPSSLFHQPYTDQAIREKLLKTNVEMLLGHELIGINENENCIDLKLHNLDNQEKVELTCNYLIGADGGSSSVRRILGITQEDLNYNRDWVVIDVELRCDNSLGDCLIQVCDKERLATFVPSHLPFRRWEFIIHEHEDKDSFLEDRKIHELISKWLQPSEYKIIRKAVYQFHSVLAEKFQMRNCFLIGDAAHQAPPFMGEGMMSGYRDAINLSWKIALSIKKNLSSNLLQSYELERKPHSRFVVKNSAGIGELMEAYAEAENPEQVPSDLVDKGYGSFIIPNLLEGLFYKGKANKSKHSGEIYPQPILYRNKKIYKRLDHLLGKNFAILSKTPYEISDENQDYLNFLGCSSLILEEEYLEDNPWLESFMKQEKIYLVRPDRYIFGSTDSSISLDQLIDDLKNRIGI